MRYLKTNNNNWRKLCKGQVQAKQLEINFNETGGEIMKFEKGQTIKVEITEGTYPKKIKITKIGQIVEVTKRIIVIQYKNYRESFSIADFQQYDIYLRVNGKWDKLNIK